MITLGQVAPDVLHELAVRNGVCVRPVLSRMTDTVTGEQSVVPIPCGSTQERQCPPCADRARKLRMQQCREGWHRDDEIPGLDDAHADDGPDLVDELADDTADTDEVDEDPEVSARRVRSTRRRQDAPDLPRVPMENRTVGTAFVAPNGRTYRPSMFLTLTLPSYGKVRTDGTPVDPDSYDYHRAALDALHFPKILDRFWQNLRRCAGYKVQYFATVEAQRRLAPHLHAAVRGVIPRQVVKDVAAASYTQLWWPQCSEPVYTGEDLPTWDELAGRFTDPVTGAMLPTWDEALDAIGDDDTAVPAHVVRLGTQLDYQGIIGSANDKVGKAIGYLTKYLAKSIADTYDDDSITPAQAMHLDRLHREVRWLPCSPTCHNWLRFGVQPKDAEAGMRPGWCPSKAHDRHHLGLGGRRVLVSRQWTGKTLTEHKADRAEVVRQTLAAAGIEMDDTDRCSATATADDGSPRFIWEAVDRNNDDDDLPTWHGVMARALIERIRWRTEYEQAKNRAGPAPGDTRSATSNDSADTAA